MTADLEPKLDRLTRLVGTDEGFYILALHAFVEYFLRYEKRYPGRAAMGTLALESIETRTLPGEQTYGRPEPSGHRPAPEAPRRARRSKDRSSRASRGAAIGDPRPLPFPAIG